MLTSSRQLCLRATCIAGVFLSACASDGPAYSDDEIAAEEAEIDGSISVDDGGKFDFLGTPDPFSSPPTDGLLRLEDFNEDELATLFSNGTATRVPVGIGRGYPLLAGRSRFGLSRSFNRVASLLWAGKTLVQDTDENGEPLFHEPGPDGVADPRVTLTNRIGGVADIFAAVVTRQPMGTVRINESGSVAPPQEGESLEPYLLSLAHQPIVVDGRPSVLLNYHEEPTPVINRVLDEIREVDAERCPGLYLGRAHIRPITRGGWQFWTYFAMDFGYERDDRRCEEITP